MSLNEARPTLPISAASTPIRFGVMDGAIDVTTAAVGDVLFTGLALSPRCPLWVKSRHVQRKKECPLYPESRHLQCNSACPLSAKADISFDDPMDAGGGGAGAIGSSALTECGPPAAYFGHSAPSAHAGRRAWEAFGYLYTKDKARSLNCQTPMARCQDPALRLSFYCKRHIRILFAE